MINFKFNKAIPYTYGQSIRVYTGCPYEYTCMGRAHKRMSKNTHTGQNIHTVTIFNVSTVKYLRI